MVTYIRGNDNLDSSNVATDTELASAGPSTNYGDVGTYVLGYYNKSSASAKVYAGDTMAGSVIYPMSQLSTGAPGTGNYGTGTNFGYAHRTSTALSGTWRVMGPNETIASNTRVTMTVMVRIS